MDGCTNRLLFAVKAFADFSPQGRHQPFDGVEGCEARDSPEGEMEDREEQSWENAHEERRQPSANGGGCKEKEEKESQIHDGEGRARKNGNRYWTASGGGGGGNEKGGTRLYRYFICFWVSNWTGLF
ncbi:hypothetical protein FRC02_006809 [Tulasnella sp. 418]|nr:hypothetical protein FRC02_006809 [Tulasnella sp. 418]